MYCQNCDSELCNDQKEFGIHELGKCHDCSTPEELEEIRKCKDFWNCEDLKRLQDLQKISEYNSAPHKWAHEAIVRLAKSMGAKIKDLEIY